MVANATAVRSISGAFKRSAGGARTRVIGSIFDSSSGFNDSVLSIAVDADNKVVCVGAFTSYAGTTCNRIARINTDGSLDTTFNSGTGFANPVIDVKLDSDGKILCCGSFDLYNSASINNIARINTDGSLDTTFDTGTTLKNILPSTSITLDSNGKVYVTGRTVAGTGAFSVVKFDTVGSLDTSFANYLFDDDIGSIIIDENNKVLCCGAFTSFNGTTRQRVARLDTDGSLDTTFDSSSGFNDNANDISIDADGKIVVSGVFTEYDGTTRQRVARLDTDGSLDTTFDSSSGFNNVVNSLYIQSNGKIICGGSFGLYDGTTRQRVARLNTDGSLDTTFDSSSGFNISQVNALGQTTSSKIMCGGNFISYDGVTRQRIARLNTDATLN